MFLYKGDKFVDGLSREWFGEFVVYGVWCCFGNGRGEFAVPTGGFRDGHLCFTAWADPFLVAESCEGVW